MISDKLAGFFKGYLYVRADSRFIERFMNVCMHRGIKIYDIKRHGSNRITFKTDFKSFFNIRIPARRTKTSVRIIKRCGLPVIIKRYKKRRFVAFAAVLVLAFMWYVSNHVMGITVFGNNRIPTELIRQSLEECGLHIGMRTDEIVSYTLRNDMMNKLPDLAWVGINANGSRVYVEIVERIEKEEGIDKNAPACDLVARCDGEIDKMEIREGQAVVEIGSGVRKGDVLVSGITDNPTTGFSYVHARGDVFAKTRYVKSKAYPLNYTERIETGKNKTRFVLCFDEKEIPLYKNNPYNSFNKETKDINLPDLLSFIPEITVRKEIFKEVREEKRSISPGEAEMLGRKELMDKFIEEEGEKEVLESNISYTLSEWNEAIVTLELVCRENIAKEYIIEVPAEE